LRAAIELDVAASLTVNQLCELIGWNERMPESPAWFNQPAFDCSADSDRRYARDCGSFLDLVRNAWQRFRSTPVTQIS